VVPKRVPGQLAREAVILVQIVAGVGEHEVGLGQLLQPFERLFDRAAEVGEEAVAEVVHDDLCTGLAEERGRALPGLVLAAAGGRENDPGHLEAGDAAREREQGRAAADLDVVGVAPERENTTGHRRPGQREREHRYDASGVG
jgi:hypothetical protein